MRALIIKETNKLCKKYGKILKSQLAEDLDFNFMSENVHLMNDVSLLTFYTTLVAYGADLEFKRFLLKGTK